MNKQITREIYPHLENTNGFDQVSSDQELFEFLEEKKASIIAKVKDNLVAVLSANKSIEEMTMEELSELGIKTKPYEVFLIVDEDDKIIRDERGLPIVEFRKNCHISENREFNIHRASDFLVVNKDGKILLSQRASDKDLYPSFFEIGGGHLDLGESYEKGAFREFSEELGVELKDIMTEKEIEEWKEIQLGTEQEKEFFIEKVAGARKFLRYMLKEPEQTHYGEFYSFVVNDDSAIKIDGDEVVGANWYTPEEIMEFIRTGEREIICHQKYVILNYLESQGYKVDDLKNEVLKELKEKGSSIHNEKKL